MQGPYSHYLSLCWPRYRHMVSLSHSVFKNSSIWQYPCQWMFLCCLQPPQNFSNSAIKIVFIDFAYFVIMMFILLCFSGHLWVRMRLMGRWQSEQQRQTPPLRYTLLRASPHSTTPVRTWSLSTASSMTPTTRPVNTTTRGVSRQISQMRQPHTPSKLVPNGQIKLSWWMAEEPTLTRTWRQHFHQTLALSHHAVRIYWTQTLITSQRRSRSSHEPYERTLSRVWASLNTTIPRRRDHHLGASLALPPAAPPHLSHMVSRVAHYAARWPCVLSPRWQWGHSTAQTSWWMRRSWVETIQ